MAWQERRYSPWLLKHEESLRLRMDSFARLASVVALLIAFVEALLPWETLTPAVPHWVHIAFAALALPLLHLLNQADLKRKEQAFAVAFSDKGRRLLFLDPYLEPEEYALSERMAGSHLLPLQRQIDTALKMGGGNSLHRRLDLFYRTLPSTAHEGDRLGILSLLHVGTFFTGVGALALVAAAMPGFGLALGDSRGLSVLPLLLLLYLYSMRANTRFGYESAMFEWLRRG